MNNIKMENTETKTILDVRKLLCPLPVIRAQQAIKSLSPHHELQVRATDPGVIHDIPAWCRIHGHTVKDIQRIENEILITIVV